MTDLKKLLKENLAQDRKGIYLLVLNLPENVDISVGKLGINHFEKGTYFYIGRAKGGFSKRILRYFSKIQHKKWYIDYLLEKAKPIGIFFMDNYFNEENFADKMAKIYLSPIKSFGSTDTKAFSHLFYTKNKFQ